MGGSLDVCAFVEVGLVIQMNVLGINNYPKVISLYEGLFVCV